MISEKRCEHLTTVRDLKTTQAHVCEECVKTGSRWVHLRTCQTCGVTLCCDSSRNQHATAHFQATGHPVMASAEPGERWLWCYVDQEMAAY